MSDVYVREDARLVAAIIAGNHPEMDRGAARVHRSVRSVAIGHRLTGDFIDGLTVQTVPGEIGVGRQVNDRVVSSTDPGTLSIEYGHFVRYKNSRRVRWIPGQHPMARGMAAVH